MAKGHACSNYINILSMVELHYINTALYSATMYTQMYITEEYAVRMELILNTKPSTSASVQLGHPITKDAITMTTQLCTCPIDAHLVGEDKVQLGTTDTLFLQLCLRLITCLAFHQGFGLGQVVGKEDLEGRKGRGEGRTE